MIEIKINGEAEIASLKPDDVLLVKLDGVVDDFMLREVRQALSESLPEGIRILVTDERVKVSILRPESEAESAALKARAAA